MIFTSIEYFIFIGMLFIIYYSMPLKIRWVPILFFSVAFCSYASLYSLVVLVITVVVFYSLGLLVEKNKGSKAKKFYLYAAIVYSLSALFIFKYIDFFNGNVHYIAGIIGWNYNLKLLGLIIPLGLSYYIFQSLSYLFEIYNDRIKPEKNIGIFACYMMFFPKLASGPIERPQNLLNQFRQGNKFDYYDVTDGMKLFVWGMFKKLVVADRLAILVDTVYNNPSNYKGIPVIIATVFFSFQIYADFSGYTDMAIGSARIFGYKLSDNFRSPYISKSISEFWTRWHITLSQWLRDYVFLPIAYAVARRSKIAAFLRIKVDSAGYIIATVITMTLIGAWHGAGWTFIAWGLLHGIYMISSHFTKKIRRKTIIKLGIKQNSVFHNIYRIIFTFTLVSFAWIFFKSDSIGSATQLIHNMLMISPKMIGYKMGLEYCRKIWQ